LRKLTVSSYIAIMANMISSSKIANIIDRTERYITPDRYLFAVALMAVATFIMWVWTYTSGAGLLDGIGRPIGTDFSSFYTASQIALSGKAADVYNPAVHFEAQRILFAPNYHDYYGFFYPPTFLLVCEALALVPYKAALFIWQAGGMLFYFLSLRFILPRTINSALLILGFPAVFLALGHGQNSFLTVGLFVIAFVCLRTRPVISGICFGLLAYKPQLALIVPIAMIASRNWRAFISAALTVMFFAGMTAFIFGANIFMHYAHLGSTTRVDLLEKGGPGWHKLQSLFAALRAFDVPVSISYILQALLTLLCIIMVWRTWRSQASEFLKYAILCMGCLLATPFVLDYDLLLLAPALIGYGLHAAKYGWQRGDKIMFVFIYASPIITRIVAERSFIPLGFIGVIWLGFKVLKRTKEAPHYAKILLAT
jgi:alpha-1,2-mannosyltransferase